MYSQENIISGIPCSDTTSKAPKGLKRAKSQIWETPIPAVDVKTQGGVNGKNIPTFLCGLDLKPSTCDLYITYSLLEPQNAGGKTKRKKSKSRSASRKGRASKSAKGEACGRHRFGIASYMGATNP